MKNNKKWREKPLAVIRSCSRGQNCHGKSGVISYLNMSLALVQFLLSTLFKINHEQPAALGLVSSGPVQEDLVNVL